MRLASVLGLVILLVSTTSGAETWPQFRGPTGDGNVDGNVPLSWSETQNVKWKAPIHGKGWSSPVIWGDQIWVTTATEDGKRLSAIGLDRHTGKVLHDVLVFEEENPQFCHVTNSYASSTPVIDEGRLYVHFGSAGTACLDTQTGQKIWERRDLECNHWRGAGSSPILQSGKLIVAYDGYDYQYVMAFDAATGQTSWKKDRNIDYETDNGDRMKAYSTATVFTHNGQLQVVSPSAMETISYDPETGSELWRVRHGGMNAAAKPLYAHGLVYIAAGDGPLSLVAVRPEGTGDLTDKQMAWTLQRGAPKRPSQIIVGDLLFMINDEGIASCLDAKTGVQVWQKRLDGEYRASPIHAQGRIYFSSLEGRTPVIAAAPRFQLLADNQLDDGFQASPAAAGNSLYLRTTKHLYCIAEE